MFIKYVSVRSILWRWQCGKCTIGIDCYSIWEINWKEKQLLKKSSLTSKQKQLQKALLDSASLIPVLHGKEMFLGWIGGGRNGRGGGESGTSWKIDCKWRRDREEFSRQSGRKDSSGSSKVSSWSRKVILMPYQWYDFESIFHQENINVYKTLA